MLNSGIRSFINSQLFAHNFVISYINMSENTDALHQNLLSVPV